jgi:uncharacterized tellurite resistance protein B-like protein
MFNLFKKTNNKDELLLKTASLLIHTAKIDGSYSDNERDIIKKTIIELGIDISDIDQLIASAENIEEKSNQILEFTKEIKSADEEFKIKIIETLWTIIYSDKEADIYESNLMRRLSGLLYLDNKTVGNIKEKIKKKLVK